MPDEKPEIFVSYKWEDQSQTIVDEIDASFESRGVTIIRDKRDAPYRASIEEFMKRIGKGKYVILVISKEYLRARNCMFELLQISKNPKFYDRIYPIVLEDSKIYTASDRLDYIGFWDKNIKELDAKIKSISIGADIASSQQELQLFVDIRRSFDHISKILSDLNALTPEEHRNTDFKIIFDSIFASLDLEQTTGTTKRRHGLRLFLNCDRKKQRKDFFQSFKINIKAKRKLHFYQMCCEERDVPALMIDRFQSELKYGEANRKLTFGNVFHTIETDSVDSNMSDLRFNIANIMIDKNQYDIEPAELYQTMKERKQNMAVVSHQLTLKKWDEVTKKTIRALVRDFWNQIPATKDDDPDFVVCFNFILSELEEGGFMGWFKKNSTKKVKKELEKLVETTCNLPVAKLEEPERITKKDIEEWATINKLYGLNPSAINQLIKKIFSKDDSAYMQDVIGDLELVTKELVG